MGTQQILLIVLSVIIVGVAIVVGIGMFNRQAYNSNKTAIGADAQQFAAELIQHYKTPISQGGAMNADGTFGNMDLTYLAQKLGLGSNENGAYTIENGTTAFVAATGAGQFNIVGIGRAKNSDGDSPKIVTTITFPAGTISAVASDQ